MNYPASSRDGSNLTQFFSNNNQIKSRGFGVFPPRNTCRCIPIIMTKRNQKKGIVPCPPLSVRVTPEEREVLRQHAGERSISDYVRSKLFEDGAPQAAPHTGRLSKHQRQKLMAQTLIRLGELQTPRHLGALTEAIEAGLIDADSELIECQGNHP